MVHETLKDVLQKACCSYKQTNFRTGSCFDLKHGSPMFGMFRKPVSVLDKKKQQNNYVIQNHVPDSPKRNAVNVSYATGRLTHVLIIIRASPSSEYWLIKQNILKESSHLSKVFRKVSIHC